jgi:hypothetical protein
VTIALLLLAVWFIGNQLIRAWERWDDRRTPPAPPDPLCAPVPPSQPPPGPSPLPIRQVPVQRPRGVLPLPRAFRRPIPPHEDPPLDPAELAHVTARWPHIVSSYFREDHPDDHHT